MSKVLEDIDVRSIEKTKFEINQDTKLERGDMRIKSGSIEMSDIVSKKIKFSIPDEIEKDLEDAKLNSQK